MGREKKKPKIKNNSKSDEKKSENKFISQPLAPVTQPTQGKKRIVDLKSFLKRQQSISPPTVQQKFSLQHFLKNSTIQSLALGCPNLQSAIQTINQKISINLEKDCLIDRNFLYSMIEKYLHGGRNYLWCNKYYPCSLNESLHSQIGQKIKIWLRSYNHYRNTTFQDSNSFIDDFLMQTPNTELKFVRQFNWKLKGLIIKGRSGIGKTTIVKTLAKDLEYDLIECGNDYNQIKYLKEKNQATQSECVRMKVNKNQNQIKKNNKSITTFTVKKIECEPENDNQTQKIQLMHEVNNFYPEEEEVKFQNELRRTIQSSKIPFIMTHSGAQVSQNFKIYDVIQFKQAETKKIAQLLYLIYQIEKAFKAYIQHDKIIEKDKFKTSLNSALQNFQFNISVQFSEFVRLVEIFNKKLDLLFTFVENSLKYSNQLNLNNAEQIMKDYLLSASPNQLMNNFFYNSEYTFINQKYNKDEFVIKTIEDSIDMSVYLLKSQKEEIFNDQEVKRKNELKILSLIKENQPAIQEIQENLNKNIVKQSEKDNHASEKNNQQQNQSEKVVESFTNEPKQIYTPQKQLESQSQSFTKTKTNVKQLTMMQNQDQCILAFDECLRQIDINVIQDYRSFKEQKESFILSKMCNQSRQQLEQNLMQNISMQFIFKIQNIQRMSQENQIKYIEKCQKQIFLTE